MNLRLSMWSVMSPVDANQELLGGFVNPTEGEKQTFQLRHIERCRGPLP